MLLTRKKMRRTVLNLLNHPASPDRVARGIAVGVFCAFIVPVFQMALAFVLALLVRGSRVPALLFTWISNPLTIPFLFPLQCLFGSWLIGHPLTYSNVRTALGSLVRHPTFSGFAGLSGELVFSFLAGGLVVGLSCGLTGFFVSRGIIVRFRERKAARRLRRLENGSQKAGGRV